MACNPNTCTPQYGTCNGNRASCATNAAITFAASVGTIITASSIQTLQNAINSQVAAYSAFRTYAGVCSYNYAALETSAKTAGSTILASTFNNLKTNVVKLGAGDPGTVSIGGIISSSSWTSLYNSYNTVARNCICNGDCGCNIVCSCNYNCGCNYSDERLKKEIKYC